MGECLPRSQAIHKGALWNLTVKGDGEVRFSFFLGKDGLNLLLNGKVIQVKNLGEGLEIVQAFINGTEENPRRA
jgi:hypothetical protein